MQLGILYSFRRCPYALRARLTLQYAAVPLELREVSLRDKPIEMLAISPKGTVPVLQLGNGLVLEQSLDIMAWALAQADPDGWCAPAGAVITHPLIALNDGPFKQRLDQYKYATSEAERISAREAAVTLLLAPLNDQLSRSRQLLGEQATIVDAALVPFVRQFARVDSGWFQAAPLPALQRWLKGWLESDLFIATLGRAQPAWKPGDTPKLLGR